MSQQMFRNQVTNPPWRLRCLAAAIVAICCAVLAASESADVYSTDLFSQTVHYKAITRTGWPLPAIDLIRKGTVEAREGDTFRPSHAPVTGVEAHWTALFYDVSVVGALIAATLSWFLPWRDCPRPRFSLADIFVLLTCATIGSVVWYQMCASQANTEAGNNGWLIVQSAAYLIITLAAAGSVNGLMARAERKMRQQGTIANSASHPGQ